MSDEIPPDVWVELLGRAPTVSDSLAVSLFGLEAYTTTIAPLRRGYAWWANDAQSMAFTGRVAMWRAKLGALRAVEAAGAYEVDIHEEHEHGTLGDLIDDVEAELARAEVALSHEPEPRTAPGPSETASDSASGAPAPLPQWVQLAKPSRQNDKWGPLVPFLDYAMRTTHDDSNDGVLRRMAEVCRALPEARAHCASHGIDIDLYVPIPATRMAEFKRKAFEHRRALGAYP